MALLRRPLTPAGRRPAFESFDDLFHQLGLNDKVQSRAPERRHAAIPAALGQRAPSKDAMLVATELRRPARPRGADNRQQVG
jgi:hypothetical protein